TMAGTLTTRRAAVPQPVSPGQQPAPVAGLPEKRNGQGCRPGRFMDPKAHQMTSPIIAGPRPLRGRYQDIVYSPDADWTSHYEDKFRARRGVMLHAVRLGWSLADCRVVFLDDHNPGSVLWTQGNDGRELGSREALRRLTTDHEACTAKA